MSPQSLEEATAAVDAAWLELKQNQTEAAEAAYDQAYQAWKSFGAGRGVGRPASGDQSLTSTERAQAARARQQQSAARWEKVAPLIQQLRHALTVGDGAAVSNISRILVKETEMILSTVEVIHAQPDSDFVVLFGMDNKQRVLAFIPVMHLEDLFELKSLSGQQANLVVDRNIDVVARIISAKYERGEHRPYSRFGSTLPRVDITLADLAPHKAEMTDTVLDLKAGFVALR